MMNYNELVAMLMALADNDGKTFKAGKPVAYKSGWQVATHAMRPQMLRSPRCSSRLWVTVACAEQWYLLHRQLQESEHQAGSCGYWHPAQSAVCTLLAQHETDMAGLKNIKKGLDKTSPLCYNIITGKIKHNRER